MRRIAVFLVAVSVLSWPIASQELSRPEKRKNVTYYLVSFQKYKPGRAAEAHDYINNHFVPVDRKVGRKTIEFNFQSGEWDHIAFFPLSEGYGELEWTNSPANAKWWAALAEQEGSAEKAQELFRKFLDTMVVYKREIAHQIRK